MLSDKSVVCPPAILSQAKKSGPVSVVIANAADELVIESVQIAFDEDLIYPILVGDGEKIKNLADQKGWDDTSYKIFHCIGEREVAAKSVELIRQGQGEILMKGHIHSDVFLEAVVNCDTGLRTKQRLTHSFCMFFPKLDKPLIISDAAVNIAPDLKTKQSIIENNILLCHALGITDPKIAILSATEDANPNIPSSIDAEKLTNWAHGRFGNAMVFGPLAMDNAISSEAADIKGIKSPVAGNADVLVVPSIESGNIIFKAFVYCKSACAAGIVMGAKVPIVLTSRADPPAARLASLALAKKLTLFNPEHVV